MKKITKLSELKKLDKTQLLDEMMKGTIKGGSSCGAILTFSPTSPTTIQDFVPAGPGQQIP